MFSATKSKNKVFSQFLIELPRLCPLPLTGPLCVNQKRLLFISSFNSSKACKLSVLCTAPRSSPVSYTHLTLPTILLV